MAEPEVAALLAAPNTSDLLGLRDRAMLELLYSSGLRRAELATFQLDDLRVEGGVLIVKHGKGGRNGSCRSGGWLEPCVGLRVGSQFVVVLEDDGRRIARFKGDLVGALHLGDPVADERVTQDVARPGDLKGAGQCGGFLEELARPGGGACRPGSRRW